MTTAIVITRAITCRVSVADHGAYAVWPKLITTRVEHAEHN
jgi:hypothetical protein